VPLKVCEWDRTAEAFQRLSDSIKDTHEEFELARIALAIEDRPAEF